MCCVLFLFGSGGGQKKVLSGYWGRVPVLPSRRLHSSSSSSLQYPAAPRLMCCCCHLQKKHRYSLELIYSGGEGIKRQINCDHKLRHAEKVGTILLYTSDNNERREGVSLIGVQKHDVVSSSLAFRKLCLVKSS